MPKIHVRDSSGENKEKEFKIVPPGTYVAVCHRVEKKWGKGSTGKPWNALRVQFKILEGEYAGEFVFYSDFVDYDKDSGDIIIYKNSPIYNILTALNYGENFDNSDYEELRGHKAQVKVQPVERNGKVFHNTVSEVSLYKTASQAQVTTVQPNTSTPAQTKSEIKIDNEDI